MLVHWSLGIGSVLTRNWFNGHFELVPMKLGTKSKLHWIQVQTHALAFESLSLYVSHDTLPLELMKFSKKLIVETLRIAESQQLHGRINAVIELCDSNVLYESVNVAK